VPALSPPLTGTILVADDSAGDRLVARSILEGVGYEVLEARDGNEALEVARSSDPDLVILDVVMPRIGGLETCRILKAQSRGEYLPVLMVSTRSSVSARVDGLRSGADDYLGKPYDQEELQARVEVLLRTRAAFAAQARVGDEGDEDVRPAERLAAGDRPPTSAELREAMADELARAARYSDPLALLQIAAEAGEDDGHGHGHEDGETGENGDTRKSRALLLRSRVEALVRQDLRRIDLVDSESAEALLLLLPDTHFPGALTVAERIVLAGRAQGFAINIGVSFFPNLNTANFDDMVAHAGAALVEAAGAGGGKICLFQHQGYLYAPASK